MAKIPDELIGPRVFTKELSITGERRAHIEQVFGPGELNPIEEVSRQLRAQRDEELKERLMQVLTNGVPQPMTASAVLATDGRMRALSDARRVVEREVNDTLLRFVQQQIAELDAVVRDLLWDGAPHHRLAPLHDHIAALRVMATSLSRR